MSVARRLLSLALWTVVLFLLWLVLVGTVAWLELVAGAVAALIGAVAAELLRSRGLLATVKLTWLPAVWRPLVQVFADFVIVMDALVRTIARRPHPPDRYRVVDLSGARGDQRAAGWRAFAAAAGSLAPNTVVVEVDRERRRMLVHELVPGRGRARPL
jgi:multisubunit Na+/H+ antiporter MnhE subunit